MLYGIQDLVESLLMEAAALTKGSQRIMNNPSMVADLADAIRDDARTNPASFPTGSARSFQKATDESLAQWFLEGIDKIEKEGYEGVVYSRDGVNSDWIVRRYIAGSHNWEDITGVMNMNLRDWYVLKNRNLLDANHRDIPKFNSVREIGRYMTLHYQEGLEEIRAAAKNAAMAKLAKTIKVVDNQDYKIFISLNRAAARAVGLGTQWCTANTNYDGHFHRYAGEAFLFQMFPKEPETVDKISRFNGKHITGTEKYQFGADFSLSFKDIADDQVSPREVKERFPYLYTDIVSSLTNNKQKIEQAFETLDADETLQNPDFKIKKYNIDDEIKKLKKFVDDGYMTVETRQDTAIEQPPTTTNEETVMENIDKDVADMLNSLKVYDQKLTESVHMLGMVSLNNKPVINELSKNTLKSYSYKKGKDVSADVRDAKGAEDLAKDKEKHGDAKGAAEWKDEADWLNKRAEKGAGKIANATVKIAKKKDDVDESADKSKIPAVKRKESGKPDWKVSQKDLDDEESKNLSSKKGLEKAKDEANIKEEADQEVIAWMKRFNKLGNII